MPSRNRGHDALLKQSDAFRLFHSIRVNFFFPVQRNGASLARGTRCFLCDSHDMASVSSDSESGTAPPPPYSPQRPSARQEVTTRQERSAASASPATAGADPSVSSVPRGTAQATSTAVRDRRSHAVYANGDVQQSFPPPPPPPSDRRARSSSRTTNERPQPLFSLSALTSRVRSSSQAAGGPRPEGMRPEAPTSQNAPREHTRRAVTLYEK